MVQLGDLGAYAAKPGSQACFNFARGYLHGLSPLPYSLVTGNHDLEGFDDFSSDAENLEAWRRTFGQNHYWAVKQGAYLLIGLSTVRFRDAPGSCHEVYIDPEQLAWFEETLQANQGTPTIVFSHAPPMGCGLRAPAICLSSYLERIFKYANCSPACYVLAFIYLERLLAVRWPAAVARAHRLARGRAVLGAG